MGIDYDGGIIIGADACDLSVPEDYIKEHLGDYGDEPELYDWTDVVGLETMSEWYSACYSGKVYGFRIKDRWGEDELEDFISLVKEKMKDFKELTGVDAELIGMQNIY